jgi:hypothetical protein
MSTPISSAVDSYISTKMVRQERGRQEKANKLAGKAYMGDKEAMGALMELNPQLGMQVQKQKQLTAQSKTQQATALQDRRAQRWGEFEKARQSIGENAAKYDTFEDARGYAQPQIDQLKQVYPDIFETPGLDSTFDEEDFGQARTMFAPKKGGFQQLVSDYQAAEPGSEERGYLKDRIVKESTRSGGISVAPDGTVTIGAPVEKTTKKKLEENIISSAESLSRLDDIERDFDEGFLTYGGQFSQWAGAKAEKLGVDLGDEGAAKLQQYRRWSQGVEREFNSYRKLITGAAAAVSELKDLQKAIINTKLSPSEWKGAMESYKGELKRAIRLRNKYLREGLSLNDKAKIETTFSSAFSAGGDDDVMIRGEELEAGGKTPEQTEAILESEGYL